MSRVINLRASKDAFDPRAPFKVLAVMCHPTDRRARAHLIKRLLMPVDPETGDPAISSNGNPLHQVGMASTQGKIAGDTLLSLIQLHHHYPPATVNQALALVHAALPPWNQPKGPEWHERYGEVRTSTQRARMLTALRQFLPVSHLWATLIVAEVEKYDAWPGSNATLPEFLGIADALARYAKQIPWRGRDRQVVLPPEVVCRFSVPEAHRRRISLSIPLFNDKQRNALAQAKNR